MPVLTLFLIILGIFFISGIRIVMEYQRGVVFRLGRFSGTKSAGLKWIIPIIDKMRKVDLRIVTMDIPSQDVITMDNVSLKVNAVLYFRVMDAEKAVIQVEHYLYATSQLAQTTLRSVLGEYDLDSILSQREQINQTLQDILDKQTDAWGIKVSAVELKHVDLPEEMKRAMARQAEAERERRAKVIHAEGEFQAAQKLADASDIIGAHPPSLHLRFLSTLSDIATEQNSTILFPIPMDLISGFMKQTEKK